VEINASLLAVLGLREGEEVRVSTRHGTVTLVTRVAELPGEVVFIPYGPLANSLVGGETGGTGMPGYKGVPVMLEPARKRGAGGDS